MTTHPPLSTARRSLPFFLLLIALGLVISTIPRAGSAQFGTIVPDASEFPATVRSGVVPAAAFPGETVRLDVTVDVERGWSLYAMDTLVPIGEVGPIRTTLAIRDAGGLEEIEDEPWTEPQPGTKIDPGFEVRVAYHTGRTTFSRKMLVPEDVGSGEITVSGTINFQVCDDETGICLNTRPPERWTSTVLVRSRGEPRDLEQAEQDTGQVPEETEDEAEEEEPAAEEEDAAVASATELAEPAALAGEAALEPRERRSFDSNEDLLGGGLTGLAWKAFLAGLITLLTPCVFPMIPLTISFFTKRANHSTPQRVGLCGIYAGSIILGFAILGFGLALLLRIVGMGTGSAGTITMLATNPWVNLGLAAIFVAFGLSLLGLFDIALPSSWANKLQGAKKGRGDVLGAMVMAVIFVLVSFTCTAPIVGPLIILTFGENWLRPFVGMTAYGAGIALPFFFLGLVPGALNSLPKSGDWLNATKVSMGLVEIAAAMKFLSNTDLVWAWGIFTREIVLASWAAIALIIAFYLLGTIRTKGDKPDTVVGPIRMTWAATFGTLGLYLAFGLFGGRMHAQVESFLPPTRADGGFGVVASSTGGGGSVSNAKERFINNDLERAKEMAIAQGKPLFIDFTGWTCTNCRLNELNYFSRPSIIEKFDEFVVAALYTDDRVVGDRYSRFQSEQFGTIALPYYAIVTPEDETEVHATYAGLIRSEAEFHEFLDYALESFRNRSAVAASEPEEVDEFREREVVIRNDIDSAIALAEAEDKLLFVEFVDETNSTINETRFFQRASIVEHFEEYVVLSLVADDAERGHEFQQLQSEMFGTFALPFYAITNAEMTETLRTLSGLIRSDEQIIAFLNGGE